MVLNPASSVGEKLLGVFSFTLIHAIQKTSDVVENVTGRDLMGEYAEHCIEEEEKAKKHPGKNIVKQLAKGAAKGVIGANFHK